MNKKSILMLFLLLMLTTAQAQLWIPDEHYGKGQYWETDAFNYQNYPYTIFNHTSNISIEQQKINLKNLIISGKPDTLFGQGKNEFYTLYKALWNFAWGTIPPNLGNPSNEINKVPLWAKAHAFICFMNINPDGEPLTSSQFETLGWTAEKALQDMNTDVMWWEEKKLLARSRELIAAVQAYDLLKACGRLKDDRNHDDITARDNIRRFTRNIYKEADDAFGVLLNPAGWKKNHGISTAAALGMAAIVLNECGAGYWYDGWKADTWARMAHWGMNECLFDAGDRSVSKRGGLNSFSEGPGYFEYCMFETALPFFITFRNFVTASHNTWTFPYGWGNKGANNVKNYMFDQDIKNIYEWYYKMQQPNGGSPTYDNSDIYTTNAIGIFNPEYNTGDRIINLAENGTDLRADYLAALGGLGEKGRLRKSTSEDLKNVTQMDGAGNMILRMNQDSIENRQYFHMLYETGAAVDFSGVSANHEDDDIGSFTLDVDKDNLAIDPAYRQWPNVKQTNKFLHHNVVMFNNSSMIDHFINNYAISLPSANISNVKSTANLQSFNLNISYEPFINIPLLTQTGPYLTRNVNQIRLPNGLIYYLMNDYAIGNSSISTIKWQLNGNGNINEGFLNNSLTKTFTQDTTSGNRIFKWKHPCSGFKPSGKWNLYANVAVLNGQANKPAIASVTSATENGTLHDNANLGNGFYDDIVTRSDGESTHTRVTVEQNTRKTIFQSVLIPYQCSKESELPVITKQETANHIVTNIFFKDVVDTSIEAKFLGKNIIKNLNKTIIDTISHFHFAKWEGNTEDSVTNPFNLSSQATFQIKLDAQKAYVKHHTYAKNMLGYKYCPASTINIKHASFIKGTYLKFKDTTLINATKSIDASISFASRQMYLCSINPLVVPTSADSVSFYLSDISRGVEMLALKLFSKDTVPSRYDSLTNTIHIALPMEEITFYVQEKQNCINCYFPPTWLNIQDTFEANDGASHILGNKLTIKPTAGLLNITNSTKIEMCDGVYLRNKNNLIIEGPCQSKAYERKVCKGIDSMVAAYSDNSAITIGANSALVLELGSNTYVKNGGAIYVKQNGSLIVKAGAFLQIGDSGTCQTGWGEIIAEPGAFIHIEPGAIIEYRKTIGDTVDRNLFLIPTKAGLATANHGVYGIMQYILADDTILPSFPAPFFTYPICGLDTTCPIQNKEWGYTSFSKPIATFQTKNDTLCPNEPLYIKLNRIVNDARYQIKVCRMDSLWLRDLHTGNYAWQDTCISDTLIQDSIPPDPICKEPRNTPEDWTYYFNPGTLHRVTISVWNDCELYHDTTAYIYVSTKPDVEISIPTTACAGIGTFNINILDHHPQPVTYAIEVTEKPDTNFNAAWQQSKGILANTYTQSYFGLLPNNIGFGNYNFKGGRTYLVSLTISNNCGTTSVYDSITIQPGVIISLSRPTAYAQQISTNNSIQLNGYISTADSFTWSPNTWLNRTDTLSIISTPTDSITYMLTAYKDGCTATDTVHIKYNRFANAGYNDTLCLDSNHNTETLIGFPYDMSLFIGMLYYYDNNQFMNHYNNNNINNAADYFRYFTYFMHTSAFQNSFTKCPSNVAEIFTNAVNKKIFFSQNWYLAYYSHFIQFNDATLGILTTFNEEVNANSDLKNHLDSLTDWGQIETCMGDMFTNYNNFVLNDHDHISANWSKIVNNDTTLLSNWDDLFIAIDAPTQSSKYLLNVITPDYAEIDEITILVDTLLTPLFIPALQFDSTVYFMNLTEPISTATKYQWNFGDGSSSSFDTHPIHTFPAFDSNYVVCLIASNTCNSFTHCDTVRIDSAHLGGSLYTKKQTAFYETNKANEPVSKEATSKAYQLTTNNCQLSNYPNPFNTSTIIDYRLPIIEHRMPNAELRITNVLGQTLFTQKLNKPIDKIQIDGNTLSNGIYYYSIIIDGSLTQTKSMSVIH